jgi:glutaredoxin 2
VGINLHALIDTKEKIMFDLYILEHCPYCNKVRTFMDENGIKYNKIDIEEAANEEALIKLGGKRQVPFLVDKDRNIQMYESLDIIEYLKTVL